MATYELDGHQRRVLEVNVSYAKDAATRLPRVDWWNAVVGALVAVALTALIPPEAIRAALLLASHALVGMLGMDAHPKVMDTWP